MSRPQNVVTFVPEGTDIIVGMPNPALTSYQDLADISPGMLIGFFAVGDNTGPVTISLSELEAKDLCKLNGAVDTPLVANDIRAGQYVMAAWYPAGGFFQMLTPLGNATNPTRYLDLIDQPSGAPGDPPIGQARLHSLSANGFSVVEMRDGGANVVRLASDNILVGKVNETAGVQRGQLVYLAGAAGANPLLKLAKADFLTTLPTIGMALDPGANNIFIRVLLSGTLQLLNTSAFAEGSPLYVSPTAAGGMTTELPLAPAFAQRVGFVTRTSATQGEILLLTTAVAGPPRHHGDQHGVAGVDPVIVTDLAGYPGDVTKFLRADGSFAVVPAHPFRLGHTWGLAGNVTASTIPASMFVPLMAGQTATLVGVRAKINSGTSIVAQVRRNGVNLGSAITVNTTVKTTAFSQLLAADDEITFVLSAPTGTPANLSLTMYLEHTPA